jgi:hypothetical protein
VAAEPSFLALPMAELAEVVGSDGLQTAEESVFKLVMNWVKQDEEARKGELDRLLPRVRVPLMTEGAIAMMAEPLVARHPLAAQLGVGVVERKGEHAVGPRLEAADAVEPLDLFVAHELSLSACSFA